MTYAKNSAVYIIIIKYNDILSYEVKSNNTNDSSLWDIGNTKNCNYLELFIRIKNEETNLIRLELIIDFGRYDNFPGNGFGGNWCYFSKI